MRNSVELTLARLAFRQLTASRRSLWAVLLAALPVLIALPMGADASGAADAAGDFWGLYQMLIVAVLLPIVALVVGTGVFGAEVEDGTLTYVLGKPVARWRMVLTRIVVAGTATAVVLAPATYFSGWIALRAYPPQGGMLGACTAAVVIGGFLYCALFVALSLSTRRALMAGLGYVVLWEGLLSSGFGGSRALSVRQYTLAFAEGMSTDSTVSAQLEPGTAAVLATVVAVLAAVYAIRRLRRFEIGEAV
ncbi:MAG TPA: ABC transporter permease subunit [Longimicrobium sp.]|nr:ABC transporter permease subunit [Longimicrobium sp.]